MNSEFSNQLIEDVEFAWPLKRWDEFHVVVAVSGGADSVALLRTLVEIKKRSRLKPDDSGSLIVAHFNHQLRGPDSDADADFVSQLSAQLGLEFHGGIADERQDENESKSENHLRDQRYRFLNDVAHKSNSRYIVTAHHREDQIETVLFRLFRGTGLKGMGGIPFSRIVDDSLTIVRPLLHVKKSCIEKALVAWEQSWREDATNAQSRYTRNFLRNEILPALRDRFPHVDRSIASLANQALEHSMFLEAQTPSLLESVVIENGVASVDCRQLAGHSRVLLRGMFVGIFRSQSWPTSQLGFTELDRLARLVRGDADQPLFQLPGGINCEKTGGKMRLGKS